MIVKQLHLGKLCFILQSINTRTGLLPVPTGSFSSSVGGGKLWNARISSRQMNHFSAFSAKHAP